ncbi:MAG: acetyltransferase [bacterium]|jgi:sugar O-acyltransferase (sialic acid O-acetyltransferase NeuD family)
MEDCLIIGAGDHARSVINIIELEGRYRIAGLVDDHLPVGAAVFGYEVLSRPEAIATLPIAHGIVCIGDNWLRSLLVSRVRELRPDFRFITAIHPGSTINRRVGEIGAGTKIFQGAVIEHAARIGEHCLINPLTLVGHDSDIGNFVNVHPGVNICGDVRIGSFSTLAVGVNVINGVRIGEHTVIGAGSTVVKDIGSYTVAFGTPCKPVRERKAGEAYL